MQPQGRERCPCARPGAGWFTGHPLLLLHTCHTLRGSRFLSSGAEFSVGMGGDLVGPAWALLPLSGVMGPWRCWGHPGRGRQELPCARTVAREGRVQHKASSVNKHVTLRSPETCCSCALCTVPAWRWEWGWGSHTRPHAGAPQLEACYPPREKRALSLESK